MCYITLFVGSFFFFFFQYYSLGFFSFTHRLLAEYRQLAYTRTPFFIIYAHAIRWLYIYIYKRESKVQVGKASKFLM